MKQCPAPCGGHFAPASAVRPVAWSLRAVLVLKGASPQPQDHFIQSGQIDKWGSVAGVIDASVRFLPRFRRCNSGAATTRPVLTMRSNASPSGLEIAMSLARKQTWIAWLPVGTILLAGIATAQQKPRLISAWDASDESSAARIDHSAWQETLDGYLLAHSSGINRFDYASLKANPEDTDKLADYLASLQRLDPRKYSRAEQKAYWINLYNALTVRVVLDAYPVSSIRRISDSLLGGLIFSGPWEDVRANVAGLDLTLDDIEHGILRPIYRDSRIHYGVNCASLGCPNLIGTAFTAANTEILLDAAAREYVNHPRGVDFVDEDFIVISSVYSWFVEDFGGSEAGVIEHLAQYAEEELAQRLRNFEGSVEYEYDWDLNQP